jgi:hypothetical protein
VTRQGYEVTRDADSSVARRPEIRRSLCVAPRPRGTGGSQQEACPATDYDDVMTAGASGAERAKKKAP